MDRIERTARRIRALPILRQIDHVRYERIFARNTTANLFDGVYATFAEAREHIPDTKPVGYDHPAAAGMYAGASTRVRLIDYPVIFWLKYLVGGSDGLFDYGGHVGLRYYAFRGMLELPEGFRWRVWDVPEVTRRGRELAAFHDARGLEFTDDASDAADFDIFLALGSLQYFEEALPDTFERLGARPRHVLINDMPLHERHEFVTINNMTTAFCPYKVYRRDRFLERMAGAGYELRDLWRNSNGKHCEIPFHEQYNGAVYTGMYFTDARRESA